MSLGYPILLICEEALFKDLIREDCPICMLLMPLVFAQFFEKPCCWQPICAGCHHAQFKEDIRRGLDEKDAGACPFCRASMPRTEEDIIMLTKKGMEENKAEAFNSLARYHVEGRYGFPKDITRAIEMYLKSGELGCSAAYCNLGHMYREGAEVEKDMKKARHYYELAAMGGNIRARLDLGGLDTKDGNVERALKHFMIGAKAGHKPCLDAIKFLFESGFVREDVYREVSREHQKQLEGRRSVTREEALLSLGENFVVM